MTSWLQTARIGIERVEAWFDAAFTPAWNPFYHLGALGWFFYWVVAVSGIYLYVFFDTGVTQAYDSVEYLTHVQWYAGGVMRSLHRYASDALMIVMVLHLLRELIMDRLRGVRWFSWVVGVPLLWFVYASGLSGYWLVWDRLAQYIAITTTEWLDSLGIFGEPIARNFLNEATLSGRFFTLMVFIHIAVPLILLFLMWIHIQRMAHAKVNPPKGLAAGTLGMLLALSFLHPAVSQAPANLDQVPATVALDWFYLPAYPLLDVVPGLTLWGLLGGGTLLLLLLPWLPRKRRQPVAVVDLGNCNGCGRCYADCPYTAISMAPRSDGRPFEQEAIVHASRCASCGICAGACPTSTPFRRASELVPGIDMPAFPIRELREHTLRATGKLHGTERVIVYGCQPVVVRLGELKQPGVAVVALPCIAMLPPSFLDFLITKGHVDGVFLTGCREGDCYHRLGIDWMEQRIARDRDPFLRSRVPRERIGRHWAGLSERRQLARELAAFRATLRALSPLGNGQAGYVRERQAVNLERHG